MARAVRTGLGERDRLSRWLVRDGECALAEARARFGKFVADRLGRSHLRNDGVRPGSEAFTARLPPLGWYATLGSICTRRPARVRPPEEWSRLCDPGDRRQACLCVVRQPR